MEGREGSLELGPDGILGRVGEVIADITEKTDLEEEGAEDAKG
jgi:hypothetical protein